MWTRTRVLNAPLASTRTHLGLMVNAKAALMGPSLTMTRPTARSATLVSNVTRTNQKVEPLARVVTQANLHASRPQRRRQRQMRRQKGQTLAVTARSITTRHNYLERFLAITVTLM